LWLCTILPRVLCADDWQVWDNCELLDDQYFDGDSFHVRRGSLVAIFRLYYVDAPETSAAYETLLLEQAEWFKVAPDSVLRAGEKAKTFTHKFLAGTFRVRTRLEPAPGASRSQRYYGIIECHGRRLDATLVQEGLARVSGAVPDHPDAATARQYVLDLRKLEYEAARARRGIWAFSNGSTERLADAIRPRLGPNASSERVVRRVNVNAATVAELVALPGIGAKTADLLIRARPIKSFQELDAIPGIGPKTIEALRDLVRFE
jgi:endonuclease YncB( thermonuclease family)